MILECGYNYWMDPQHEETPYTLKVKSKELTVLSYFQDLNDYSSYQRAGRTPRDLLQMWKDCFDCLYEEGATDPKFMMWGNHPFVGGRPFRALLLREFIRYAKKHEKVWFATAGEDGANGTAKITTTPRSKSGRISTSRAGAARSAIWRNCDEEGFSRRERKVRKIGASDFSKGRSMLRLFCVRGDSLARRQVGKIEDLIGGNFFGDVFSLAGVADGVGN